MKARAYWGILVSTAVGFTPAARGGPDFIETIDAGSFAPLATKATGSGTLAGIKGELMGFALGGGDFEDMYLINICDPLNFVASTVFLDGGSADFDTQLWLLNYLPGETPLGFGLLANDEGSESDPGPSRLLGNSDDGSGAQIGPPGLYLLAISVFNDDPFSSNGIIYDQESRFEISGPDGNGGLFPHSFWLGNGIPGTYRIDLTGACYIELCEGDVNGDGMVNPIDSGFVLARLGCVVGAGDPECDAADANGDGMVDPLDAGYVQARFGDCP